MSIFTRVTPRFVLLYVTVTLAMLSLSKLAYYELTGAASRLRSAVGQEIRVPSADEKPLTVAAVLQRGGRLKAVRYQWNDTLGFFDLRLDYGHVSRGVSPREAVKVEIIEKPETHGARR